MDPTQLDIILKLLIAVSLGGIVGFEREVRDRPAGLRTHMLTAIAATLLVSLAVIDVRFFTDRLATEDLQADPLRVFEAIIVGISFIGAGTILKGREVWTVKYLTTAASILVTAAIGIAIALEQYLVAVATALLVAIINYMMGWLEAIFFEPGEGEGEADEEMITEL